MREERKIRIHILLLLTILLFLATFIVGWFNDHLVNRLFIFVLPIYVILQVCFVVLMILSIVIDLY